MPMPHELLMVSQRVFWDAYGPIGPICTARHGGTTFTDYVPGPEAPPSPDYIPGLEYPEYLPPADDVLPAEEQLLSAAVSPTAELPGYITDSEPKMEPEEEDGDDEKTERDSIEYPTSRGDDDADDDGDDLSRDDADDEDEEESLDSEEEEEEHLDPTVPAPALHSSISASEDSDQTEPFEEGETAATPPPFGYCVAAKISVRPHIPMPFRSESEVERLLAIPTPSLSPVSPTSYPLPPFLMPLPIFTPLPPPFPLPLLLPSTSCSKSSPEADIPLRERARFITPTGGYKGQQINDEERLTRHIQHEHAQRNAAPEPTEKNVTESLEASVLERSSSQPKSTYDVATSLSEFELTKILIDKMEKNKSYDKVDYKRKSSKEAESSKDLRSKEKKSSSTSKDASHSQHKTSGKSAHTEEPSHLVDDSRVQQNQEFDTGNNDEQPADNEVSKADCQVARAKEPTTSFDELLNTLIDFSAFILNRLNIKDLTQAILVGLAFDLLKGTYKSLIELEYHLEECSKAATERLDWHNHKGKQYPFDFNKPFPLIPDHRGRQVIPKDYFINNDLEYLKSRSLSRQYSTSVTKTKAATYEIKWIKELKYEYGHLEEIEVRREDQKLYKFREGDFPRLRLQDIKDMLLLLVQLKLTNLTIDERYDLNVILRMFTRQIVIQRYKDGITAKEEMEWIRQTKSLVYDPGYRKSALSKKANAESGEVCW
nr:hypothetical protein [Tanacetum cinerariifolium]